MAVSTTPNLYESLFAGPADANIHNPETRAKLQAQFASTAAANHGPKWDEAWKMNLTPWDKGFPNPALVDLLESGKIPLPRNGERRLKALVAGCGKGYDILLLSAFGYDAYGLDISTTALTQAKANASSTEVRSMPVYATRNSTTGNGVANFIYGDFFKDDFKKEVIVKEGEEWDGKFDLLYDFTFGCALPPSLRPQWSLRYSQLLSSTGHLICLEFPITKPETSGGPPWALPEKVYMAHLRRPGENLEYAYDKEAVKDLLASEERWVLLEDKLKDLKDGEGLVRVDRFKPERTHDMGYNEKGEVLDMVSVWRHQEAVGK